MQVDGSNRSVIHVRSMHVVGVELVVGSNPHVGLRLRRARQTSCRPDPRARIDGRVATSSFFLQVDCCQPQPPGRRYRRILRVTPSLLGRATADAINEMIGKGVQVIIRISD